MREVHDEIYANFERKIRSLLIDVASSKEADMDIEGTTLAITALLKGIWVEWSLIPGRADPQRLAEQILRMLPGWDNLA